MTNKTRIAEHKHPPEQKRAEDVQALLDFIGTQDAGEALERVRSIAISDPLVATLSINRATGRVSMVTNVSGEDADLEILAKALMSVYQQLIESRVSRARQPSNGNVNETVQKPLN